MALVENGPGALTLGTADRAAAVADIKARLRIANSDEDALIAAFAETALGLAERFTGQASVARPMVQRLAARADWQMLGARPVRMIAGVADLSGAALPGSDYAIDVDADGLGWVRVLTGGPAKATFEAGLASGWASLPPGYRDGAAMLAAHLFDDRSGQLPIPAAVTALWRPFRVMRLDVDQREGAAA